MMAKSIFINYRRVESLKDAQHLATLLGGIFGKKRVFIDVRGIHQGEQWLHALERQVAASAAMVALIGKGWLDAVDEHGRRRLDNPNDFVRFEIVQALTRGIPVLPVLLDGAPMPRAAQLPDNLVALTLTQAAPLRAESIQQDAAEIAKTLKVMMATQTQRGVAYWAAGALAAASLAAGILAGPRLFAPPTDPELRGAVAAMQGKLRESETNLNEARAAAVLWERRYDAAVQERDRAQQRAVAAETEAVRLRDEPRKRAAAEKARDDARVALAAAQAKAGDFEWQLAEQRARIARLERDLAAKPVGSREPTREQLAPYSPKLIYILNENSFHNLSQSGALKGARLFASRDPNGNTSGELRTEGEVKESGEFDVSSSETLKANPPSEFYLRTADGFLYKGTALLAGPSASRSMLFRITELVSVPARALAIFPLRGVNLKLETFAPNCLVLEPAASDSLPLKGEQKGKIAYVHADSDNPIAIGTKFTVKPAGGDGCKFTAKEFEVSKDAVLYGLQNAPSALEALNEGKQPPADVFAFLAKPSRPHVVLVVGLSPEFLFGLKEDYIRLFFERFPNSFKKLDLSRNGEQTLFEKAHVLISTQKGKDGDGPTQYEEVAEYAPGAGLSLFAVDNNITKVLDQLERMRFFIPTSANITDLKKSLPTNPASSSTIVFLGGAAKNFIGSCRDGLSVLKEDKGQPGKRDTIHEKFAFIVALKADDEPPTFDVVKSEKGDKEVVSVYKCEPFSNIRVYFFSLLDAVGLKDRGQEVQERIFVDIAKWSGASR